MRLRSWQVPRAGNGAVVYVVIWGIMLALARGTVLSVAVIVIVSLVFLAIASLMKYVKLYYRIWPYCSLMSYAVETVFSSAEV